MSTITAETTEDKFGLDRIVFFSDAVIAIAITLLVIEITPPEIESELVNTQLANQVLAMWPKYLGFVVSFWVIASYWVVHHRMFRIITNYNRSMMYINLLFLMFIAFMPYTTALLFEYPAQTITVIMYAGLVAAIGFTLFWLWTYVTHDKRLVGDHVTQSTIKSIAKNMLITPVMFLISMPIALINPLWAMYSWILLVPLYIFARTEVQPK